MRSFPRTLGMRTYQAYYKKENPNKIQIYSTVSIKLDPTNLGLLKKVSTEEMPLWWEDVESWITFEKALMLIFNRVGFFNSRIYDILANVF